MLKYVLVALLFPYFSKIYAAEVAEIIGQTRSISSSGLTGAAPGRVECPPTSKIKAPASIIDEACCKAASIDETRLPLKKESGVMFKIPMILGAEKSINCPFKRIV